MALKEFDFLPIVDQFLIIRQLTHEAIIQSCEKFGVEDPEKFLNDVKENEKKKRRAVREDSALLKKYVEKHAFIEKMC